MTNYQTLDDASLEDILDRPEDYLQGATSYFFYDLFAWKNDGQPVHSINLLRETHVKDLSDDEESPIQTHIAYSDGFGRVLQNKVKVDSGEVFLRDTDGELSRDTDGNLVEGQTDNRWLISGRTVYNNKAKPVKQYEPFYSSTAYYEPETELTEYGVTPILHYDPLLRVIQIDTPNGFFSKVEFTPWVEKHYDENDTVTDSEFYQTPDLDEDEQDALDKAAQHDDTPEEQVLDNQGRPFLVIQIQDDRGFLKTQHTLDIEGDELSSTDPRLYERSAETGRIITISSTSTI